MRIAQALAFVGAVVLVVGLFGDGGLRQIAGVIIIASFILAVIYRVAA